MFKRFKKKVRFKWIEARVFIIAARIRRRLQRGGPAGLFIDCGSNLGQGFKFFRRYFPASFFDALLIEPNPNCASRLRENFSTDPGVELIEAALASKNGEAQLFGLVEDERGAFSDGASIVNVHNSKFYEVVHDEATTVRTQRLSDIIQKHGNGHDVIVAKMDIEGAEYEVFDDLIETGMIDRLDAVFIEFHSRCIEPDKAAVYAAAEDRIRQAMESRNILFIEWI